MMRFDDFDVRFREKGDGPLDQLRKEDDRDRRVGAMEDGNPRTGVADLGCLVRAMARRRDQERQFPFRREREEIRERVGRGKIDDYVRFAVEIG